MRFLHPAAFALLALAILILILSILRARQRRREVALIALWDGLMESTPSLMTSLRYFIDLELLLQLACLIFLTAALAEPIWQGQRASSGAVALVIDTSASMLALTPEGATRHAAALERAEAYLAASPSAPAAVLELSESPRVLVSPTSDHRAVRGALAGSSASFRADGTAAQLASLLDAVGGPASYQTIVVLTDRVLPDLALPVRYEFLPTAGNVAITAFTVRENPSGAGVSAFVEVANDGPAAERRLTVRDESARTTLDVYLEPGETSQFVVPFPVSRGSRFVASLDRADAAAYDDTRYASISRSLELRVRWLGDENRFLAAAIEASLPITRVDGDVPADLTVAYGGQLEALPEGNVLLVHAAVRGLVSYGPPGPGGPVRQEKGADPLLAGVEPNDIYVERIDSVFIDRAHEVLLTAGASPFAIRLDEGSRRVLLLNSDLYGTNLSITVDFPLLIRNFLGSVARLPGRADVRWHLVGQPVDLTAYGSVSSIATPAGHTVALRPEDTLYAPDVPGAYEIRVGEERFPLAVNVDADQSARGATAEPSAGAAVGGVLRSTVTSELRSWAAAAALVLLLAEAFVALDTFWAWKKRRSP